MLRRRSPPPDLSSGPAAEAKRLEEQAALLPPGPLKDALLRQISQLEAASRLGYRIQTTPPTDLTFGGVHVIARIDGRWVGAADPRRDGAVRGY